MYSCGKYWRQRRKGRFEYIPKLPGMSEKKEKRVRQAGASMAARTLAARRRGRRTVA